MKVPEVNSITFTGSFVDLPDLSGISDIDTIVIVDKLTPTVFQACSNALTGLDCSILGLSDHELHLNTTFGPLKFDGPRRVVIHLMVYSTKSHRQHVIKSPFTCLDWERSEVHVGPNLRHIYPVLALQPRQFLEARRGLANYLEDLAAGSIQYRRYVIEGDVISEITDRQPLDPRHQGEYAYHIVRNLIGNYAKLLTRENKRLTTPELIAFWHQELPVSARHCDWFMDLETRKRARALDYPTETLALARDFLLTVGDELDQVWRQRAIRHLFVRHAHTACNDGSFLGQRRDPAILEAPSRIPGSFAHVYSSPARRCKETAAGLTPESTPMIDQRLHEIDYGQAEGLHFPELQFIHPEITTGWKRGEDPSFPGGENTAAVTTRLNAFLADMPAEPSLVVTHNVVLRCLLGPGLGLPQSCWHRIPISNLEQFEVLHLNGQWHLNLLPVQIERISDAVAGHCP